MHRNSRTSGKQRSRRGLSSVVVFVWATLLVGFGSGRGCGEITVEVLSSPAEYVSGGDARILVDVPRPIPLRRVKIRLNGEDVTAAFHRIRGQRALEGVVTNLNVGDNVLEASAHRGRLRTKTELILTNHDRRGPIFSGPQQTPFLCADDGDRANAELGPAIDADCSTETVVSFKYRTTSDAWVDYDPTAPRPADMAQTTTLDGDTVDFIVRWERGTINRFIYSIAVLSPDAQDAAQPDLSAWNKRLIYYFQGGVAIGRYQGDPSRSRMLYPHGLSLGYAVAYSTGTKTGTHYNLQVGGETAIMVKDRFVSAYGNPDYTVGVGGSGGGIQQYIYAQNHPGLIDAGVPQRSYPDMITQTIHVGDCELLERWIDLRVLAGDPKWVDWQSRAQLEGMNASNDVNNPFLPLLPPGFPSGSSECINGWRGLSPLVLNPLFGTAPGITPEDQVSTEWTHFADAINIYGVADDGFAASPWDNVGVQYGLQALRTGFLTIEEFLDLNANAGSWKNEPDMVQEGCPFLPCPDPSSLAGLPPFPDIYPNVIDPWSWRNMALSPDGGQTPAPRKEADPGAIEAAYDSGLVNRGDVQIPLIDVRDYLEGVLDMHNSHQSFAARQRLLNFDGDASNQIIWFAQPGGFDPTPRAFEVIDEWMANIARRPWKSIKANRPEAATDTCYAADGSIIHAGVDAWDGILDSWPEGPCTQIMPPFATSRIVAGGPITGDIFKCHLIPVADAIAGGIYGPVELDDAQQTRLEAIFPSGVCDYTRGDARRP